MARRSPPDDFYTWLAQVLREEREKTGMSPEAIAPAAGTQNNVLRKFERGITVPRRDTLSDILWAYSYFAGREDPRDLLIEAALRWKEFGTPPRPTKAVEAFVHVAAERAHRTTKTPLARRGASLLKR